MQEEGKLFEKSHDMVEIFKIILLNKIHWNFNFFFLFL